MEYRIHQMARLAGVSTRTLRYYDGIGLLSPSRAAENGYRLYGQKEVDRLQQILFYRELGVPLETVRELVRAPGYDAAGALEEHLSALKAQKERLEVLIANVEKTIAALKGEITMSDKEKFEGFKRKLVMENEAQYGGEIRRKYGDAAVDAGNEKLLGLTEEEYEREQELSRRINETLKRALEQGDPAGPLAQEVCALHREWLGYFWPNYSRAAHLGLGEMYAEDPGFRKYYDDIEVGCAEFLRDALRVYCAGGGKS